MMNMRRGEMMKNAQLNDRGQVTIPKIIREKAHLKPKDLVKIDLNKQGQIVITKRDYFDDIDDLIRRDLVCEDYAPFELEIKVAEKKKELASALLEMVKKVEMEIVSGEYVTLDELKEELNSD